MANKEKVVAPYGGKTKNNIVGKFLTIESAIKSLSKKNDCRVTANGVYVLSNNAREKKHDLGNSSCGKIDFLRKMGVRSYFVDQF